MLGNFDLEVSLLTADAVYVSKGDKVDVGVPADLDQLGRDNSHGALIGGEGLVQLGHDSPYSGRPFHEVHVKA
jgi:hypothetical protein